MSACSAAELDVQRAGRTDGIEGRRITQDRLVVQRSTCHVLRDGDGNESHSLVVDGEGCNPRERRSEQHRTAVEGLTCAARAREQDARPSRYRVQNGDGEVAARA